MMGDGLCGHHYIDDDDMFVITPQTVCTAVAGTLVRLVSSHLTRKASRIDVNDDWLSFASVGQSRTSQVSLNTFIESTDC
jgi:hypothetical protein